MKKDREFRNESLEAVANIAKSKGYKVYTFESSSKYIEQIFFVNQEGKIGSASAYFSGVNFSTIHKPNRECGTGFRIGQEFEKPENLDIAFSYFPNWASEKQQQNVKKYQDWEEKTKGCILNYYEL